mgnify:CR=1 FL=1
MELVIFRTLFTILCLPVGIRAFKNIFEANKSVDVIFNTLVICLSTFGFIYVLNF